jgi:large subunit ribosomal protein L1
MAKKMKTQTPAEEAVQTPTAEAVAEAAEMKEALAEVAADAVVEEVVKTPKQRSVKYQTARGLVDRTVDYPLLQAVEMVKNVSYSKFDGTITLHCNLKKEIKPTEVTLPFSTGKTVRVAIADETVLADLAAGKAEFDVLIATPAMMPKLAKFARVLGPKGLMPNPKNGTVTNDPETKKASLMTGSVTLKSEKKTPLLHVRVGKVSQPANELAGNVEAMLKAIGTFNVLKATLSPSMGPGVKVKVEK